MKILIAEDLPVIQLAHKRAMERWGFAYDLVSDGAEAVALALRSHAVYDLCIMDVEMPVMDGTEAVRIIRRGGAYLPVLGFSSDVGRQDACFRAGMDAFERKPCPPDRLFAIIRELAVKRLSAHIDDGAVFITGERPMNADELKELRELKKAGLTKLKVVGLPGSFVVHKNIQNKISHELVTEGREVTEFIDRSPSEPARCHLYRANPLITRDLLLPEELGEAVQREDEVAEKYVEIATGATRRE